MLRLAAIFAYLAGVSIVGLVHDSLVSEAETGDIDHAVAKTQSAMQRASELVLDRFPLRTDVQIIRYPNRFQEKRGATMWAWMMETLPAFEKSAVA
jgi:hypothetical protein